MQTDCAIFTRRAKRLSNCTKSFARACSFWGVEQCDVHAEMNTSPALLQQHNRIWAALLLDNREPTNKQVPPPPHIPRPQVPAWRARAVDLKTPQSRPQRCYALKNVPATLLEPCLKTPTVLARFAIKKPRLFYRDPPNARWHKSSEFVFRHKVLFFRTSAIMHYSIKMAWA